MSSVNSVTRVPLGSRGRDRKSTRLNSSHTVMSYAVFCLKKKKINRRAPYTHQRVTEPIESSSKKFCMSGTAASRCSLVNMPDCAFFFNDTAPTEIYTLSLHDALPI